MALQKDEVGAADASGVAGAQPVTKGLLPRPAIEIPFYIKSPQKCPCSVKFALEKLRH